MKNALLIYLGVFLITLTSCKTPNISQQFITEQKNYISYRYIGGLIGGSTEFALSSKGYYYLKTQGLGKAFKETKGQLKSDQTRQLWKSLKQVDWVDLKDEYQVAHDGPISSFNYIHKNKHIKTVRYSAGAPQSLKDIESIITALTSEIEQ